MTSESEAKRRLEELCKKFKLERDTKSCQVDYSSGLGVSTPYDSDYDMMELKIVSREVSNWEDL